MSLVSQLELPPFDPYADLDLRGDRYHDAMRDLASHGWLAQSPLGYYVLDHASAEFFLRTRKATFPGMKIAELFDVTSGPLYEQMRRNILHVNGDAHRRLRNLVNPAFTPRAAERWRPAMRGFLAELFEPVAGTGRCDAVADLAKPYPSLTIATVVGAPLEMAGRLWDWSNWIQRQFDAPSLMTERPRIERAVEEFYAWAFELLAQRRAEPRDDLISQLAAAEVSGDRLDDDEVVNLVLNVLVGGVDTTQSQLAHALRLFAQHPEQWSLLAARPELAPAAVEEVVRYEPVTPFTARIVLEDLEWRGVTFPAGTIVMVAAVTGNRDGAVHDDPERFDITVARPAAKTLTFGAGIHYCLGANLARAELQEALAYLAPRMPGLRLDGEPRYGTIHGIYGLDELPLAWDARPAQAAAA